MDETLRQKKHEPIAPRLLAILADNQWHSRASLATGLKRSYGISPQDLKVLERLEGEGKIEKRWALLKGMNGQWEYRLIPISLLGTGDHHAE